MTRRYLWLRLVLAVALILPLVTHLTRPKAVWSAGIPDPRFGVVEAYTAPGAATALGAGWTRITFYWNQIQRESAAEWNILPVSDQALATEIAQGRQVVGLLVTTPGWATDLGRGAGVPQGLYLPPDDPNNHWANFVRTIVGRYAGRIDHWIIWNEPDIPASSPDLSWGGSVHDYLQLLRVAYAVTKATNPAAVVHLAAFTHHHDQHWFGRFLDALTADTNAPANNYYFDIVSLNLFHDAETIYDIIAHYANMMRGRGINKPVWITETNAYLSRVSPEQQAMFMIHGFSLEIAAGAQRIAVYKMSDLDTDQEADPEPFGLVTLDGSRRPAFTAYQVATTHLAGFRGGTWDRRDEISLVTIDRGNRTTTVVWSRTPEPQVAMVPARGTQALLVNIWGGARRVYPDRGYYFVELPGMDCTNWCQMGGEPFMLVEEAPASARTAEIPASPTPPPPSPDVTAGATADPGTLPTATPTASPTSTATPTASPTSTHTPTATCTPTPTATAPATPEPTHTPTSTPSATPSPTPTASPGIRIGSPGASLPIFVALAVVIGGGLAAYRRRRFQARDDQAAETGDTVEERDID
ncbi:MAG: hypothetical protein GX620_05170 [Chloroflexi bacterium]|nr:hypothetical protein [Chloroflexota bacterium]